MPGITEEPLLKQGLFLFISFWILRLGTTALYDKIPDYDIGELGGGYLYLCSYTDCSVEVKNAVQIGHVMDFMATFTAYCQYLIKRKTIILEE